MSFFPINELLPCPREGNAQNLIELVVSSLRFCLYFFIFIIASTFVYLKWRYSRATSYPTKLYMTRSGLGIFPNHFGHVYFFTLDCHLFLPFALLQVTKFLEREFLFLLWFLPLAFLPTPVLLCYMHPFPSSERTLGLVARNPLLLVFLILATILVFINQFSKSLRL